MKYESIKDGTKGSGIIVNDNHCSTHSRSLKPTEMTRNVTLFHAARKVPTLILKSLISSVIFQFLPPATKLGQGNIFRSVCQEFCPQGGLPHCMLGYTQTTPPPTPEPEAGTPRPDQTPSTVHAGRYGQQAGGTHPTGMQSCCKLIYEGFYLLQILLFTFTFYEIGP